MERPQIADGRSSNGVGGPVAGRHGDGSTNRDLTRRGFLAGAAGTAAVAVTSSSARAATIPDYGSYLSDANLYDNDVTDQRGEDAVTVSVGAGPEGVSFDPPTIWIDPGTTVTWEWTGDGGGHNVVPEGGPGGFEHESVVDEAGFTYEYAFDEADAGITTYKCIPHESLGMKGGVAVGDEVETIEVDTGAGGPDIEIPTLAFDLMIATFLAIGSVLGLAYFFIRFGGDYSFKQ